MTAWTPTLLAGSDTPDLAVYQWGPGVTSGDTFLGLPRGDLSDRSFQVEGTFGGATVNIQGSNDATANNNGNYHNLRGVDFNVIAIAVAGISQVLEMTAWMKPSLSGATVSTSLTITVCSRIK